MASSFYKFSIIILCVVCFARSTVTRYEDCIFNVNRNEKSFQFDLNSLKQLHTVNFTEANDLYSLNIKLCASNQQLICDGTTGTIICLVKNKKYKTDIGSKIKEVKLNVKDQLFMSLEGNSLCDNSQNYTTDITFICNKTIAENNILYQPSSNRCKYIVELTSVAVCPVDDWDIRKICEIKIPHSLYKFNLNPLRRLTNNYLVENHNRRFEVNICGRLNKNACGGNITTICDITNKKPKVFAVGYSKNDHLIFDPNSRSLKLIQHERISHKKGKRIEFNFKCNENVPPEKTKPEFLIDQSYSSSKNVAYFEVATSIVCIPRMTSCEIFTNNVCFNLKPLHKRIGNIMVTNIESGGKFYLNFCDYLNQYDEIIPTSCTAGGKTSACYVDDKGKGISIGSTQIGPFYKGNSILLKYTDGINCTNNSLKWSTLINFTCSDESQLIHDSTNLTSCTHVFHWKTQKACQRVFERYDQCMVTHPLDSSLVYNMSDLKYQNFKVNDDDNAQFQFSVCSPLQKPCNGNLDSAACLSINGTEINIGIFTEQLIFDDGKLYMSMKGDKCIDGGPNSLTTIRFVCDFSDSKLVEYKQIEDLTECEFEFIIFTKNACTQRLIINCTVNDTLGNIFDLSPLTRLKSNYKIPIGPKKKIVLNVCHSVINNDVNGIGCQYTSGVCLVDTNKYISDRYKSLGDVNKSPYIKENKIILEMTDGLYDGQSVSSIIEFVCSFEKNGPVLISNDNHTYAFQWFTTLVCNKKELFHTDSTIKKTYSVNTSELNFSVYLCPKNEFNTICDLDNDLKPSKPERCAILFIDNKIIKYPLTQNLRFTHDRKLICNQNNTISMKFSFICGFELQKPKIKSNGCVIDVLFIDPKICERKLECRTNMYDLTPLKGIHVVFNETIKYYINFCVPGEEGVGVIKEFNHTNYTMGYQTQPPEKSPADVVEVVFKNGDYRSAICLYQKIKPKIKFECDHSEHEGRPVLMKSNNKCMVEFLWKTSLVCLKNLVQPNVNNKCLGIINDYSNNFENNKVIHLINILEINEFFDYSTNVTYHVNFCNGSICNGSKCYSNMTLQYDTYRRQLIASFKDLDLTKLELIITCSKESENLSLTSQVSSTYNFVSINTYSKYVCCMNQTSKEPCDKYTSTTNSQTTNETNDVEKKLFTSFENEKLSQVDQEQIEETIEYPKKIFLLPEDGYTSTSTKKYVLTTNTKVSSSSFFLGELLIITLVLTFSVLFWFYGWNILQGIRKMYNFRLVRRLGTRLGVYYHYHL